MNAEIINIGDELLIGQVVNTNASWMAEQLNLAGIHVVRMSVVADDREAILGSLRQASTRAELILITGGLGPTNDDITKLTLCEYFNCRLVFSEIAYADIEHLFHLRGWTVTEINRQQAEVPGGCTPLRNLNGTAPGMWFEKEGCIFVSLPGVPFEMKAMMEEVVIPRLAGRSGMVIRHKTVLTQGVGESFLAVQIREWEDHLPKEIKLAYLPQPGIVRLRLTASGTDGDYLDRLINGQLDKLRQLIAEWIYGYDDETMGSIIGALLKKKGKTLATAESCTGGYIAHLLTLVPGSSAYFLGSVVAYDNRIKEEILQVSHKSILESGAVSEIVVREMAEGARKILKVDYAVAVSGIAGPDGGTPDKPVGTTWIAVATPTTIVTQKFMLGDHRERNIHRAALTAMNLLRKELIRDC